MVTTLSVIITTLALAALWLLPEPATTKDVYRLNVAMPEGLDTRTLGVAFSPNGKELVYVGGINPNSQIFGARSTHWRPAPFPAPRPGIGPFSLPTANGSCSMTG